MAREIRCDHHRRRPQRPGYGRLPGARRAQGAGARAARTGRAAARSPKRSGRAIASPPAPTSPACCRSASSASWSCRASATRWTPRIRPSSPSFPDGRHFFMWQDRAKTLAEIAKFSQHDADVYPAYEDQLERLSQVVEELLLTTPPQFPPRGIGDFVDYLKLAGKMRGLSREGHRGAGQDLHAERGRFSRRVVRIRASESHARDRRRDRRQRRTALAGHGVHPAAPLHGRRRRASRAVGLRARRHGRGVGSHRGVGARQGRRDPRRTLRWRRSWCATAARAASCWKAAKRSRPAWWPRISIRSSRSCGCSTSATCPPISSRAIRKFRIEGTSAARSISR